MENLHTKIGVILTTYTQDELNSVQLSGESAVIFISELRSFNPESECCITKVEAIELTGLEMKAGKLNKTDLYTNYKGNPFGLPVGGGVCLCFTDPVRSLRSAFEIGADNFNFDKDFFHIKIIK